MSVALAIVGAGVAYLGYRALFGRYRSPFEPGVAYVVTSRAGPRISPTKGTWGNHDGVDLAVPQGTVIYAVASGRVRSSGYMGDCGYGVQIDEDRGQNSIRWTYCHLRRPSILVLGQDVRKGDIVGESGTTGNSTGPHLHLGARDIATNTVIDPIDLGVPL